MHNLSIKESLKFGWQKTKENFGFLIGLELITLVISLVGGDSFVGFLLSSLASFVVLITILRLSRNEHVRFKNLFEKFSWGSFGHYLVAKIVLAVFIVIGIVLLIVPGVIIAVITSFTSLIIAERDFNPNWKNLAFWGAIKQSRDMTKGIKMKIFLFGLTIILLNLLGLIAFGVGLLLTIPVTGFAFAHLYNERKKTHHHVEAATVP